MACFLVPVAEAVAVTAAIGVMTIKEKKAQLERVRIKDSTGEEAQKPKTSFVQKLKWLAAMLWGGSFLLAYEHIWHDEVVPWFPFLTAASDPESASEMLHEMGTVGVTMACLITAVWFCMCIAVNVIVKRPDKALTKNVK